MNQNNPLVSIAMCTYNGEKHLKEQLDSLVNQDYQNLEILIVDDRSNDNTWNILTQYAGNHPEVRLILNEQNLGYSKNFEKAAKLCKGEYICFSDQDDIWSLNKVSTLVTAAGEHTLIYHDSSFIDAEGKQVTAEFTSSSGSKVHARSMAEHLNMYDGESPLPLMVANCISGHAMMFKRSLLQYFPEFDPRYFHDWMLAWAAFNVGTVKYVPQTLVQYRQHSSSITDVLNLRKEIQQANGKKVGVERIYVDLDWMAYCAGFKHNRQPALVQKIYDVFSSMKQGRYGLTIFLFLSKYFELLFYIVRRKKSFLSTLNHVRKIGFGV